MEKRTVAKNTIILYIRMIFTLSISLFTSRLILENLGALDYGIYGIVGNVVTLFAFLNQALVTAGQRILSFEYGKIDKDINKMFNNIFTYTLIIALIVLIVLLLFGSSFVLKLNIPDNRRVEAYYVFIFSSLSFFFSMIKTPFISYIVASGKFGIFASLSVIETVFRFTAVFILIYLKGDSLINYGVLIMIVSLLLFFINFFFVKNKIKIKTVYDKYIFKDIRKYFGWNLFGGIASISLLQGMQILINIFFNPVVNAAQAISNQLKSTIDSFAANIRTAADPTIIKHCSSSNFTDAYDILSLTIRMSSVVILIVSIPILIETDLLLNLWLKSAPEYTSIFVRLMLINMIIDITSSPIVSIIQAVGDIKRYQLTASFVILLILPLSYTLYFFGFDAYSYGYLIIMSSVVTLVIRINHLKKILKFDVKDFYKNILKQTVIFPIFIFLMISLITSFTSNDFWRLTFVVFLSVFFVLIISFFFLFTDNERKKVKLILVKKFLRKF